MMKSFTDNNIKSDLEFSKNLINNLVSKKENPVEEAAPRLSDSDKQEMTKLSEAVAEITGMNNLVIKNKPQQSIKETPHNNASLINEALQILERQSTPDSMIEKMLPVIELHEKTQKIILQFLKKYR